MLAKAYVLDDGRRVFETADGARVYDEFGEFVPPEIIDPDLIPRSALGYKPPAPESIIAMDQRPVMH